MSGSVGGPGIRRSEPIKLHSDYLPLSNTPQDAAHLARVRDNQRRSRARRKEYLQEVEGRLRECEQTGVAASAEIQAAARRVALENSRLRLLLVRHGVSQEEIQTFLTDKSFAAQDEETWAAEQAKTDDSKILDGLMKNGGTRSCGPGECGRQGGRQLSVSYPHVQEVIVQQVPKLGSTPEAWSNSPTSIQHGPQSDMLGPQTSHSPASTTGSIRHRLAPASNVTPQLTPESSGEMQYQSRVEVHQPLALSMAPTTMPMQTAQILASMPETLPQSQNQEPYQFQLQPQYPSAQQFQQHQQQQQQQQQQMQQPQPFQQSIPRLVYQPPQFQQVDYAVAAQTQQPSQSYGQGIGTNSCVYATDLITSVAINAHPADVRTDLGCSIQCDDCEVDNRTVFDVMDRYSGIPQA